MRAGIATLKQLAVDGLYHRIAEQADRLVTGLRKALVETKIPRPGQFHRLPQHALLHRRARSRLRRRQTLRHQALRPFFREMLDRGIFLAPSQFEAAFVSTAHTSEDIDRTIAAAADSLKAIAADSEN